MDNQHQDFLKKKDEQPIQQRENSFSPVKSFTPPPSGINSAIVQPKKNILQLMQERPIEERPAYFQPNPIQRLQALPEEERPESLQPNLIQKIQRKKAEEKQALQTNTENKLSLPEDIQAKMEHSFGTDFSNVELYEGSNASNIGAQAYTQGNQVHFAPGKFNPSSTEGQELIGHELTHVLQQRSGIVAGTTQPKGLPINDDASLEKEADEMGKLAAQGKVAQGKFGEGNENLEVVQRMEEDLSEKSVDTKELKQKDSFGINQKDHYVIKEYYVHDKNAIIREEAEPHKATVNKIPIGTRVKFIRFSSNKSIAQIELKISEEKVWTSFSNLTEVKIINEKQDYRVSKDGSMTFVNPHDITNTCTVLNQDQYFTKTERCGSFVHIQSGGNNFGWIKETDLLKKPKDTTDNFDSFETIPDWTELEKVDKETLTKIENNRNKVNDRTDVETYGKGGGKSLTKYSSGHYYKGKDIHQPTPKASSDIDKEIKKLIVEELFGEGGYSSINTYDAEVFTYGKGFAAGGELPKVLNEIYNNEKYKTLLLNVGIGIKQGSLVVIDSDGSIKTGTTKSVSQLIKKDSRLLSFFIELGEKKDFAEDIAEAQMNVLSGTALKYPDYIADTKKNTFKDNWDESSITLLAHLSHWGGANWRKTSYLDTKGNIPDILYIYITNSKGMISKTIDNDVILWNNIFNLPGRLKQFGKPEGIGYQIYSDTWKNLKDLNIKENKVYIKGTETILKNAVIIKEENLYRVITTVGDDLENHLIKPSEKK